MISQGGRGKRVFETRRVYSLKGLEEAAPRERLTTIIRPGVPTSPPSMHQQRKRKRNSVGLSKGNKPPPMPPRHEQESVKSHAVESKRHPPTTHHRHIHHHRSSIIITVSTNANGTTTPTTTATKLKRRAKESSENEKDGNSANAAKSHGKERKNSPSVGSLSPHSNTNLATAIHYQQRQCHQCRRTHATPFSSSVIFSIYYTHIACFSHDVSPHRVHIIPGWMSKV